MKYKEIESNFDDVISNLFADFFSTTYSDEKFNDSADYPYTISSNQSISLPAIDISTVRAGLRNLKYSFDYGPDMIPSSVLINADNIAIPLTFLFNTSITCGVFPQIWKDSFIIPLHKSGNKCDIANYRGIAKLSYIPKLFEKVISDHLSYQMSNVISSHQHGFKKGCSTTTNLLQLTTVVNRSFLQQKQTDVIYTDFSKAFDKVNHLLLKKKLHLLGFTDLSVKWIYSYLTNRKQVVRFNNSYSRRISVPSGVPQGSHLGPLLFNFLINDLPEVIHYSGILMYADDVKVFLSYKNVDDFKYLQEDLDSLFKWCQINLMQLNISKCKYMRFVRSNPIQVNYALGGNQLERVDSFQDLGVLLDSKLDYSSHITTIVNKARGVLGYIKRWAKEFNDPYVTKALYTSLVRPILEYGSIIWDPIYQTYSDQIESVQKQFLLFCLRSLRFNQMNLPPYTARLALIKLPTLSSRRIMLNVSFLFNIINGNITSGFLINNILFNVPQRPSRHFTPILVQFFRVNYADADPIIRMCNQFNKFYALIDYFLSSNVIKSKILYLLNS